MVKVQEVALYYNPGCPDTTAHVSLLKSVLVRMGVRIRNISPDQVNQTVGYLAGIKGFELQQSDAECPVIEEEMLVMKNFTDRRLDELLSNLRRAGVPRIGLKAVLTEKNRGWTFYQLYKEIKKEHEAMSGYDAKGQKM